MTSHPLTPPGALLSWLSAQRGSLRLPVVVALSPGQLGISRAVIGMGPAALGAADALELALDDTGLGISLVDRLRGLSADTVQAVWLTGTWGPLVSLMPATGPTLAVRGILKHIVPGDTAEASVTRAP